jgi:hypothetical protein
MELTNELKYFVLYWGQEVAVLEFQQGWNPEPVVTVDEISISSDRKIDHLSLRPLSSITDEEAVKISRILDIGYSNDPDSTADYDKEGLIDLLSYDEYYSRTSYLNDYLRSIGIATDYLGIPVEQWVEWGVVKLKE